jgi:hypothetical protein
MIDESCKNCKFYRSKSFIDKKEIEQNSFFTHYESIEVKELGCHRYPPSFDGGDTRGVWNREQQMSFPRTDSLDWCGEWQLKKEE